MVVFALPFARCASSLRWKRCCLPLQTADSHQAQFGANIQGQGGVEEEEEALSGPQRRPTQLAEKLEQDLDPWERGIKMGWVGWCGAAKKKWSRWHNCGRYKLRPSLALTLTQCA